MATRGWKRLVQFDYTPDGFVTLVRGAGDYTTPSRSCTRFVPDDAYGEFARAVISFKAGCDSVSNLAMSIAYDRGFGVPVSVTAPDLGVRRTVLDPFGRPRELYAPKSDKLSPAVDLTAKITYEDSDTLSYVDIQRFTGGGGSSPVRSVQILNGLLESVMQFDQGEGAEWIIRGWTARNSSGQWWRRIDRSPHLAGLPLQQSPVLRPTSMSL